MAKSIELRKEILSRPRARETWLMVLQPQSLYNLRTSRLDRRRSSSWRYLPASFRLRLPPVGTRVPTLSCAPLIDLDNDRQCHHMTCLPLANLLVTRKRCGKP